MKVGNFLVDSLTEANDKGASFLEIATAVEEDPSVFFTEPA